MTQDTSDPMRAHRPRCTVSRRTPGTRSLHMLVLACALLPLAGCGPRDRGLPSASALAEPANPLSWTVHRTQSTHRLETSSLESKEASPGNQFVVLDVSVRNRDIDPQVLPEGKLIAMDESQLQTFDTPVSLLSDDYLGLQVLSPAQSMRGKIAYEVPEHLSGVLYWSPGNGSKRILLHVDAPPAPQRTLADAGDGAGVDAGTSVKGETRPQKPVRIARIAMPAPKPVAAPDHDAPAVEPDTSPADLDRTFVPATSPAAPATLARTVLHASAPTVQGPAPIPAATASPALREVATIQLPAPQRVTAPLSNPPPHHGAAPAKAGDERRRQLACEGMVSRNDPAEKPRSLGYFSQACRDYPLPSSWRPQTVARRSFLRRVTSTIRRVVRSARTGLPGQ